MGIFETAGQFIAGGGMGYNLPKWTAGGLLPQGIGAALAGRTESFPNWRVNAQDNTGSTGATGYPIEGTFQNYPSQPINTTPRDTTSNNGSVLGTQTTQNPTPNVDSYETQMRNSIGSGWDSYTSQLNDMLNTGIPGQRSAQEGIAQTSYNQGMSQLGTQKDQSMQAVNKQQASSLKDLSENVRNLFNSGNTYLGARGAGDSSAANQYSYAIGKLGTKGRGDILSQANDRMSQIGDIYNSESGRLKSEYDTKLFQISDWFNNAQNQIRSQIGQAGLGKEKDIQALSTNLYNQALSAMQALQSETANRRSMLESWAANNSKSVGELVQNMQQVQQMPAFQGLNAGIPQVTTEGNMFVPAGYGSNTEQKKGLFG